MSFKDHFSGHSQQYSEFRPRYPDRLFADLAALCARRDLAWDCATGSGQAAIGLTEYFSAVVATDASENQIAHATRKDRLSYAVASAERSGLPSGSVDLITVAQALHWFDLGAFTSEVDRVLKEQGVLAVWTYGLLTFDHGLNAIIERFYGEIVGEYWPFDRGMVESGYADVNMPFDEIPVNPMLMTQCWKFADLMGYFNTWSACRAYAKAQGVNPLDLIRDDLLSAWGDPQAMRAATWPLLIKAWRKTHDLSVNSAT